MRNKYKHYMLQTPVKIINFKAPSFEDITILIIEQKRINKVFNKQACLETLSWDNTTFVHTNNKEIDLCIIIKSLNSLNCK